ncbi:MAG: carboxymuconolactone decarboxylase family protein [Planctomycetota bacterium]
MSDDAARSLERMGEALQAEALPEAFSAYAEHPTFTKDLMMNVKKYVAGEGGLDAKTRVLIALATAIHAKSEPWVELLKAYAERLDVDRKTLLDAIAIASTNYLYNTFFKFRHLSGTDRFDGLPVSLRAHTFNGTSLDDKTVELINIAISDLNACQPCVSGHVAKAKQLGLGDSEILESIQCAATVYAGAQFLTAEKLIR